MALSSAEAELYAMVAASAETLAIIAYAKDLGVEFKGEIYSDSSAALGISQRVGLGKIRHLRTQGLWVPEARMSNRLAYRKVLGSKNPADVLTKHVPAVLLQRHLETIGAKSVGGRAESAPELNLAESWVDWFEVKPKKSVSFNEKVQVRAIPWCNAGRRCTQPRQTSWPGPSKPRGRSLKRPGQWADWTDEEYGDESQREAPMFR